jgi:hypothetical protein
VWGWVRLLRKEVLGGLDFADSCVGRSKRQGQPFSPGHLLSSLSGRVIA